MQSREERIAELILIERGALARHARLGEEARACRRELAAIEQDMRAEELAYQAALSERRELLAQRNQANLRGWP